MIRQWALRRVLLMMASRPPDFLIGDPADPQTRRWYVTPKSLRWLFAIYAHEWNKSDGDVPHDHPYLWNVSWILRRGYLEWLRYGIQMIPWSRREGDWIFHWGWTPHRVELESSYPGPPITLFFCGPRVRTWGFHCPKSWIPYFNYIEPTSYGNRKGQGCGD